MTEIDGFKSIAGDLPGFYATNRAIVGAVSRTSVGRYYYYIFLKYREAIYHNLSNNVIDRFELFKSRFNVHTLVLKTIKYYVGEDISDKLNKLRKMRNLCDYNMSAIVNNKHIGVAISIVQYLESRLLSISAGTDLDNAFVMALNDIKTYQNKQKM
ncbi:MAG: hypothetical protein H7843_10260 [Nitrospirota bacterium]